MPQADKNSQQLLSCRFLFILEHVRLWTCYATRCLSSTHSTPSMSSGSVPDCNAPGPGIELWAVELWAVVFIKKLSLC